MTTETQIIVKKAGNKDGRAWVLTTAETFYGIPPSDEGKYQPGCTYVIEYTERESKGRTYRDIKSAKLVSNAPAASTNGAAASHNGSGGNQFRNPEQMFVEAMLAKAMETKEVSFDESAMTAAGLMLQTVWQRLWGGQ